MVAKVERRRDPPERPRDRRGRSRPEHSAQMTPDAKRDYLSSYLTDMILVAQGRRGQEARRQRRLQAQARLRPQQAADGDDCCRPKARPPSPTHAMKKVYEDAIKQMGEEKEVRARHILVETEDEAKAIVAELKKGADFAELAKAEVEGSRRRGRRRRSRLFHQGPDGAGIRRRRRSSWTRASSPTR